MKKLSRKQAKEQEAPQTEAPRKPKILFFDIETTPNLAYVWGKYEQNVISYRKEWELLSFAYKWRGESKVTCVGRCDFKDKTDRSLVEALWDLLDEADIVVAHNGDAFDNKKACAKFIEHNLEPPKPYKTIDTKKMAKSRFAFNSNSLNDLGLTLGLGKKIQTGGFELWLGCMAGDKKSWKTMKAYNVQDVNLLEKVYDKLKVWDQNHINLAAMEQVKDGCPLCSSQKVQRRGFTYSRASKRERLQCMACRHWFSGAVKRI